MRRLLVCVLICFLSEISHQTVLKKRMTNWKPIDQEIASEVFTSLPPQFFSQEDHNIGITVEPVAIWNRAPDGKFYQDPTLRYQYVNPKDSKTHSDAFDAAYPGIYLQPEHGKMFESALPKTNLPLHHSTNTWVTGLETNQQADHIFLDLASPEVLTTTTTDDMEETLEKTKPQDSRLERMLKTPLLPPKLKLSNLAPHLLQFIQATNLEQFSPFALQLKRDLSQMETEGVANWFEFSLFFEIWRRRQPKPIIKMPVFKSLIQKPDGDRYFLPNFGEWISNSLAPILAHHSTPFHTTAAKKFQRTLSVWANSARVQRKIVNSAWKAYEHNYQERIYAWLLSHHLRFRPESPWTDTKANQVLELIEHIGVPSLDTPRSVHLGYFGTLLNHETEGPKAVRFLREAVKRHIGTRYSMLEIEPSLTAVYLASLYASNAWEYLYQERTQMLDIQRILLGELIPSARHLPPPHKPEQIVEAINQRASQVFHKRKSLSFYLGPTYTKDHYQIQDPDRLRPEFESSLLSIMVAAGSPNAIPKRGIDYSSSPSSAQSILSEIFSSSYTLDKPKIDIFRGFENLINRITKNENSAPDLSTWGLSLDRIEALMDSSLDWSQIRVHGQLRPSTVFVELEEVFIRNPTELGHLSPIDAMDENGESHLYHILRDVVQEMRSSKKH